MAETGLSDIERQFFHNPYPFLAAARQQRLTWDDALGFWRVSRFADVDAILKDQRFGKKPPPGTEARAPMARVDRFDRGILNLDPPDHTRIRGLLVKTFNAKRIEAMRPVIQDLVNGLINKHRSAGHMELKQDYAHPIPATIISDMLGIPEKDRDYFSRLSHDVIRYGNDVLDADDQKADAVIAEFDDYLGVLFENKRASDADDLTTALIRARDEDGFLDEEELRHNIRLLFIAGHETTVNLICNAVVALANHPAEMAKLTSDPGLTPQAVEEFLRFDSSVQQLPRVAQADVEMDGQTILAGQMVVLMLGSANHDPDVYDDADTLDISRTFTRAKSFGGGAHFCLGAQLARIETEIALNVLLTLDNLHVENLNELHYPPNPFFRGPEAVNLTWST